MQYETIILELLSRIKKLEDDVSELKRAQEARNIAPAISACEDDTVEHDQGTEVGQEAGEDVGCEQEAEHRQQYAADKADRNGRVDCIRRFLLLSRTDVAGNDNVCTYRQANEQIDDQACDRAGCAYCGHRNTSTVSTHDYQVCSIKQQLQKAGQNNRNCVTDNTAKKRSLKHTLLMTLHKP